MTADHVNEAVGVAGFLDDLRAALKDGSFRPLPGPQSQQLPVTAGAGVVHVRAADESATRCHPHVMYQPQSGMTCSL